MLGPAVGFGVAVALMVVGLLGVLLPVVPGVGLMWAVILVYAIMERFATIDPLSFAALTVLGLMGATSDLWLSLLGAKVGGDGNWDFDNATTLALFCNGPWCDQSPRAIRNLVDAGYPPEKLKYYRGGMQMWLLLGLTVTTPSS